MSTLPQPLPEGARVALVRLRSLGDCVLTAPALALLRRARPDVCTAVVVEPRFAAVFTGNPDVDDILPPSAAAVRRWRPWVCLNLHGGTRSMWLTCASGAALRAGFEHFPAPPLLYNARIPKAQAILGVNRTVHTAEHLASAVFWLGVPQAEVPRARVFPKTSSRDGHYAVIHPFASTPDKTWPADHYDHLAAALAPHIEPIFIGAPGDDLSPFRRWSVQHGSDLEDVKSLLAGASLFIGNDSGPAHMAAASGLPLVMLWGNSNPAIWSPWKCEHVLLHDPRGIAHIDVERALQAVEHLRVNA